MKRSKNTLLLSALLSLTLLFSGCAEEADTAAPENDSDNLTEQPTADSTPDLTDAIKEIMQYLGYRGDSFSSSVESVNTIFDERENQSITEMFKYLAVVKTSVKTSLGEGEAARVKDVYNVKNLLNGNTVFLSAMQEYTEGEAPGVRFEFDAVADIILEVKITEALSGGGASEKVTYEYYTLDSTKIATVAAESSNLKVTEDGERGDVTVSVNGISYVIRGEKIIYKFPQGAERPLPLPNYEYLGYKYVISERDGGGFLQILDENYVCLSEFRLSEKIASSINAENPILKTSIIVLGNGNVFLKGTYKAEDGGDYDCEIYGEKYCYYSELFDIVSGKSERLRLPFAVKDFYSSHSGEIASRISSEHSIATVAEYDKKSGALTESVVILDNGLNIVARIPNLLPTQINSSSNIEFVDEYRFVFSTYVCGARFEYMVDVLSGKATLISNESVYMDGYFHTGGAIYDYSVNNILNFEYGESVVGYLGNSAIISDGNSYKLFVFADGEYSLIHLAELERDGLFIEISDNYVMVYNWNIDGKGKSVYRIYNSKGEILVESAELPEVEVITDGLVIVSYGYTVSDSEPVYRKTVAFYNS